MAQVERDHQHYLEVRVVGQEVHHNAEQKPTQAVETRSKQGKSTVIYLNVFVHSAPFVQKPSVFDFLQTFEKDNIEYRSRNNNCPDAE